MDSLEEGDVSDIIQQVTADVPALVTLIERAAHELDLAEEPANFALALEGGEEHE
jgi:hypothetical protein